jgi:hypothetical protein
VFVFHLTDAVLAGFPGGAAGFRDRLAEIRSAVLDKSGRGLYLVGLGGDASALQSVGVTAMSRYALAGGSPSGEPFSTLATAANKEWSSIAAQGFDVIPPIPLGWDPRPRLLHPPPWLPHGEGSDFYEQGTPAELAALAMQAANWTVSNPKAAPAGKGLVYAWNENSEGGWLSPTLHNGTDRVQAFAAAMTGPHRRLRA